MSDLWFNLAIGKWHVQIQYGHLLPRLRYNSHVPDRPWWFVSLMELEWPWPSCEG